MRKTFNLFLSFLFALQSVAPAISLQIAHAEEPTSTIEESIPTPEPTQEVTPTDTPTPEITTTPIEEITPSPSGNLTPTIEPEPTQTETPDQSPVLEANQHQVLEANQTPSNENAQSNAPPASPTITVAPTEPDEDGVLTATILENVAAPSLDLLDLSTTIDGQSATISTDKADYAPTDTALITGKDFAPNTTYLLTISSDDEPATSTTVDVTTDDNGAFVYAYQLDGAYRPNYKVVVKNGDGEVVASTTFTDAATGTLYPNGQGNYTSWDGNEDDIDETGSPSCGIDDGDENISESTTGDRESVLLDLSSIANGSTITSVDVTVSYRDGDTSGSNGTFQTFTRLNGTNLDSGTNLVASSSTCSSATQTINVADTVKSGATTLEVGVIKTATDDSEVWVGTIRAVVTYTTPPAVVWPTSWTTPACSIDPSGDESPSSTDLDGDGANPAAGYTSDANYFYFRERVDGDPAGSGGSAPFAQYAWVALLQTTAPQYQYLVSLNGLDEKVQLWQNSTPAVPGTVDFNPLLNDPAESVLWEGSTATYARIVTSGNDYYVEWAIPASELTSRGITINTTKYFATSANANNFNKDYLNCYEPQVDLVVTKTNNVNGNATLNTPFTWTLTVTNNGSASATFNNEDILQDNLPSSGATYSPTSNMPVTTSGGVTGTIDCDINSNDLDCDDDSGGSSVVIPSGASFSVVINVTPTELGTLSNPRSGGSNKCQVDPDGLETESNENNNNCSDTVTVSYNVVTNPSLTQACGLDIALVIDSSASIDSTELTQLKNAFKGFVDALLPGTPTQFSVTDFGDNATVVQAFSSNATTVKSAIDIPTSGGATNWEDGLVKGQSTFDPRADKPNLVIFASDGNPNRVDNGTTVSESQAVSEAVTVANAIKSAGIRILALGIGSDLDTANLQAISGPNTNTGNVLTSDVITTDFANLATQLGTFASQTCGGTITVTKLIDADGNTQTTNDQTPASGWTFDIGGTNEVTGQNGQTDAVQLTAGTYSVTETVQNGYGVISASCSGAENNGSQNGNSVTGIQIDNTSIVACTFINSQLGDVTVTKYHDKNANGTRDQGEETLSGWEIKLGQMSQFTNQDGEVTFSDVPVNTYQLSETIQTDWYQSNISCTGDQGIDKDNSHNVNVVAGQDLTCEIGNYQKATITVLKDVIKYDESGVDDNHLFQVTLNNEIKDLAEGTNAVFIVDPGTYSASELADTDYTEFSNDGPKTVASGESTTINIINKQNPGSISGYKYNADEQTGIADWTIQLFTCASDFTGCVFNTQTTTDQNGFYSFINLSTGYYQVAELLQAGWTALSSLFHNVTVTPGENETGKNFVNFENVSLSGHKWNDLNGDGVWDQEEPALANWTINLSGTASNSAVTNANGEYSFTNLGPGTYTLSETDQDGWTQTYPTDPNTHTVTVSSGEDVSNLNFGNQGRGTITVTKDVVDNVSENNSEWDITVSGPTDNSGTLSDGESTDEFISVVGEYTVTETGHEGTENGDYVSSYVCTLDQQELASGDGRQITFTLNPGDDVSCVFTNKKKGNLIIVKYNDRDGDGKQDENEELLSGWTFNAVGGQTVLGESAATDENGETSYTNIAPESYLLTENQKPYWEQISIDCNNEVELDQVNAAVVFPGGTTICKVGNKSILPVLTIAKTNDKLDQDLKSGDIVTYTITVYASTSAAFDVTVTDLLPDGFAYQSGSWTAASNINATLAVGEPTYASPGTWALGDMAVGEIITLTYKAKIADGQQAGIYKDLAWGKAEAVDDTEVLALALSEGYVDTNFVGTQVNIVKDPDGTNYNVEKKETKDVLGAATSALPATGANEAWIRLATVFVFAGLSLSLIGYIIRRRYV